MIRKLMSVAVMKTLFSSVYGWKGETPEGLIQGFIRGSDGSSLEIYSQGMELPGKKGVVIMTHPILKYGAHYLFRNELYQHFIAAGYAVVLVNFKGFGRSGISGISFSDDVLAVVAWCKSEGVENVIVYGLSFGAFQALHALSEGDSGISRVIVDSMPVHIDRFYSSGPLSLVMGWLSRSRWARVTCTDSALSVSARIGAIPILSFFGDRDQYISAADIADLQQRLPHLDVEMVSGAAHLECHKHDQKAYWQRISDFIDSPSSCL